MKELMANKFVKWLFVILGIAATVAGIVSVKQSVTYKQIEAKITKIDEYYDSADDTYSHEVFVEYSVNGKKYKDIKLDTYRDGFEEGQRINIKYNPKNPEKVTAMSVGAMIYLLIIGPAATVFGIIPVIKSKKSNRV